MTKTITKIFFWIAIVFILLTVYSLTIGQIIPYEFASSKLSQNYHNIIVYGLPVAILITLFGTIKKENTKTKNWIFISTTILTSILSFAFIISFLFIIHLGSWTTFTTIYEHKTKDKTIEEQRYDMGALGYRKHRIVELKPIFKFWVLPIAVDTAKINKNEWKFVNKEGDVRFP